MDRSRPAGLHCRAPKTAHFKLVITTHVTEVNLAHSFLAELQLWLSSSSLNVSSLFFRPFISSHLPFSFLPLPSFPFFLSPPSSYCCPFLSLLYISYFILSLSLHVIISYTVYSFHFPLFPLSLSSSRLLFSSVTFLTICFQFSFLP